MEEDIKILEEWLKQLNDLFDKTKINNIKERQALEHLIKEYRELEENNRQLEKWLNYYKLGDTAEEFEELFGNVPINDIEKIKKYIFQNYIPKSKTKEKIEELKMSGGSDGTDSVENLARELVIEVLQELMEDK